MPKNTLEIRDPWTMPYLEYEQTFIDSLRDSIGPKHPLYAREVYVVAIRRDPDGVIYQTADEPEVTAVVYPSWSRMFGQDSTDDPKTELLESWEAIGKLIDRDHAEWVAQFTRKSTI